jgi:replicative DNA helicase
VDDHDLSVARLDADAHRAGAGLVIADYLQIMSPPTLERGANREREVAAIASGLKRMARRLAVPVIALCQLNRGVEQRHDKRPTLSDLRESGAIEQDADIVIGLHRSDYYDPADRPGVLDAIVLKQRQGESGVTAELHFHGNTGRITDPGESHRNDTESEF